ncbi:MAG: hypothetical protein JNL43_02920 [Flavobacteriales bacterium]|nr:hypothetical protein [Flavobacteriales bacterium]HRH70906.1 hypothetical protein [Flavobacteriales bacterium]
MDTRIATASLLFSFLLGPVIVHAQADGLVAYVPSAPLERTADNTRIGFVESAVAGKVEALLPADAFQADILNARGNVKRTYGMGDLESLSLGDLRPGTWTLRVHTPNAMLVRRFVVMAKGAILWSPAGPVRKR